MNGRIVDSAFTLTFDHTYDKLVEAVKAATETGVRVCVISINYVAFSLMLNKQEAGIDVRLGELAGYIQETMESYEVEVGSKVYPGQFFISSKRNLDDDSIEFSETHCKPQRTFYQQVPNTRWQVSDARQE